MTPTYFASPAEWRKWLARHHKTERELWVGFHRRATGRPSLTWPESVDQALCYGWIDGIRKRVDGERYAIRFTPRKPGSTWSNINIARVAELTRTRRMRAQGLKRFQERVAEKSGVYTYEQRERAALTREQEAELKRNRTAWAYWSAEAPWYRRTVSWWVISAKQEATRTRRLQALINCSARGARIGLLAAKEPGA